MGLSCPVRCPVRRVVPSVVSVDFSIQAVAPDGSTEALIHHAYLQIGRSSAWRSGGLADSKP